MIAEMDGGSADVVYAVRRARAGETAFKRGTAKVFYRLLSRLADIEIPLDTGDFRLMSRRALDALLSLPEQARFIRGMVAWVGFRQVPIAYDRAERHAGETNYPLAKMMRLALDAVTGFSTAPLRLASHIGLWLVAASVLLLIYIAIGFFTGSAIQGWTSLMLVVVVLGAVQMFVLGMIGEYLGRLYIEAKRRPLYIVSEIAGRRRQGAASAMSPQPGKPQPEAIADQRDAGRERQAARRRSAPARKSIRTGVDRLGRQLVVAVLLAGQPARQPRRGGEREEQAVEPAHHLELQAGVCDQRLQRAPRVAALVVVHDVVRAPHPGEGGHGDQDLAAGLQLGGEARIPATSSSTCSITSRIAIRS